MFDRDRNNLGKIRAHRIKRAATCIYGRLTGDVVRLILLVLLSERVRFLLLLSFQSSPNRQTREFDTHVIRVLPSPAP
jgi:hypothetical protein